MEIVGRFADRVLAFYDGTVIADEMSQTVLANPRVQSLHQRHQTPEAATMLRVQNLDVSIGPIPIIRNASLDLNEGEMWPDREERRGQDHIAACDHGRDPGDRHRELRQR